MFLTLYIFFEILFLTTLFTLIKKQLYLITGEVKTWSISETKIRDNFAPPEGTSNFKAGVSSQFPRYCVTNTNNGVLEPTVAIWNNDFEECGDPPQPNCRTMEQCSGNVAGLTDSHQWIWPGFNSCPEGRFMTPTRLEGYADNIDGCPSFCASGKYSGTGTAFRIACLHICDAGAYCPAGSVTPYPCPGGTYGTEAGQFLVTSCSNCLAGFYNNGLLPATSCKSCPAGYAQASAGSSYCLPCIPGALFFFFLICCLLSSLCWFPILFFFSFFFFDVLTFFSYFLQANTKI